MKSMKSKQIKTNQRIYSG